MKDNIVPRPERPFAFQVMGYSSEHVKAVMDKRHINGLFSMPYVALRGEPTFVKESILGMTWYRILVYAEDKEIVFGKLAILVRFDYIGGFIADKAYNG